MGSGLTYAPGRIVDEGATVHAFGRREHKEAAHRWVSACLPSLRYVGASIAHVDGPVTCSECIAVEAHIGGTR
jgi:hypothetical protein